MTVCCSAKPLQIRQDNASIVMTPPVAMSIARFLKVRSSFVD
ncbi:hypothetical protein ACQ4M3_32045 [Leptolyngbya sp. AN03gr2]